MRKVLAILPKVPYLCKWILKLRQECLHLKESLALRPHRMPGLKAEAVETATRGGTRIQLWLRILWIALCASARGVGAETCITWSPVIIWHKSARWMNFGTADGVK